jgi:predicted dehydrogenase
MIAPIRYGMVGGGRDAFIGAVHRMAARLDDSMVLCAGALSSTPDKARTSAIELGLPEDRAYGTWQDMLHGEAQRPESDRMQAVVIVTPNDIHHAPAKAALEAGFHVICDKPLTCTTAQADDLVETARRTGLVFAVTYNYTGYPMVRQARDMVRSGAIGAVRKVFVEYLQGWLATPLERSGQKQAQWRTDPSRAGAGGAMGDIGSHAFNIVSFVTGLDVEQFTSEATSFVEGRSIDDDTSILLRFKGGAKGVFNVSQVCVGHRNGLMLRIYGERGSISWRQEHPDQLHLTSMDGPDTVLHRGDETLCEAAVQGTRLPGGHPEAFIEAFANVYRGAAAAMHAGRDDGEGFGYPTAADGALGVRFIQAVIDASGKGWTSFKA